jgi:hypothetical protein
MANGKKGLSPLAWVGIGCGVLVLLGIIVTVAGVGFLGFKAKQFGESMEEKPVETSARLYARVNPDIEFVSADEANRTVVFRNVETGEEVTLDASDMEQGNFKWKVGDEEMEISAQEGEGGSGTVTVRKGDEVATYGKTGQGSEGVPGWVPVFDNSEVDVVYASEGTAGNSGAYTIKTTESVEAVLDYYQKTLEEAGFTVERQKMSFGGSGPQGLVTGKKADERRTVNVTMTSEGGGAQGMVQFEEKAP